jgi:hypothetical protein
MFINLKVFRFDYLKFKDSFHMVDIDNNPNINTCYLVRKWQQFRIFEKLKIISF